MQGECKDYVSESELNIVFYMVDRNRLCKQHAAVLMM